ncbi:MAG: translocation/assembly module TamB domain-containing protein [Candidatus Competibacteraceae bacterium]
MKLRWLLWLLSGLLLLSAVAVTVLLSTQWGLETTLAAATRVLPGKLSYGTAKGSLLGPLQLKQLHYQDGELDVQLRQGELDWSPGRLLNGTFRLDRLKLDGLELRLPPAAPSKEPTEPFKLSNIPLPLAVEVADIGITNLRLHLPGAEQPQPVDAIRLRDLAVEGRNVRLGTLEIATPEGHLDLSGQLQLTDRGPLDLRLKGVLPLPPYGPVNVQGRLVGELGNDVAIELKTTGTATATLEGKLSQVLTDPGWSLQLQLEALELGKFSPDLADSRLSGRLQSQGKPAAFQAGGRLNTILPQLGATTADIQVSGGPKTLQLKTLQLRAADRPLALTAGGTLDLDQQKVDFTGNWQALVWPLQGPSQVESPRGEFTLQGTPQNYNLALQAELNGSEFGRLNAGLQAKGTEQMLTVTALSLGAPGAETSVNARGELKFADLAFQAEGDWRALRWPLTGTAQLESRSGTFKAAGTPRDYRFTATVQVQGPDIPPGDWSLEGQGSAQGLPQLRLNGRLLEGELRATLNLAWQPALRWQADVSGTGLNPGAHWPQFPGRLALRLQTQGSLVDNSPQATLDLSDLSGVLRDQAIQGRAQLAVKGQELQIPALQLTAGRSRLQANGSLTQSWDLRWQFATPDLGRLLPGGAGSVNSSGTLSGPRAKPRVDLDVAITNLAYADTAIQRLQGKAGIDTSGISFSQFRVEGQGLRVAGQNWKSVNLEGSGTSAQHSLQGRLVGGPVGLEFALSGSFDQAKLSWQGRLQRLLLQDTAVGNWRLAQPLPLQLSAQQVSVDSGCLVSPPSRLCLQGNWNSQTGAQGRLNLERLGLERFAGRFPPDVGLDSSLSGEAQVRRNPNGALQGRLDLQLSPGHLRFKRNGSPLEVPLDGGRLQATLAGQDLSATATLGLGRLGGVQAAVRTRNQGDASPLNGKVTAEFKDLGPISTLVPEVQNVSGRLTANIDLAGTLAEPTLAGELNLRDAAVEIPQLAIRIQDMQLAVTGDGRGPLQLSGSARSGAGALKLTGQWQPAPARLELSIRGENFEVSNLPEAKVLINPDLRLALATNEARVEGQVVVPEARLGIPESSGERRVGTSPDVIIVDQAQTTAPLATEALAIYVSVRVILGNEIYVNAYDFRGRLKGNVLVEQLPGRSPQGNGSIAVSRGEYIVSGQRLRIERGRLLFANSPLDNPGLDLRVTRTVENFTTLSLDDSRIVVGAQVTGTLQRPRLDLFSEPAMPDSSILSYLVLGQAPQTAQQSSFILGKYLSPQLYVGYGVGLYNAVNTFILRYRLSRRILLEATSSTVQTGADVFYTIEGR